MVIGMKVLVALDFGDSSLEALRQGRALAHGLNGTLAAVHVLPASHDLASLFPGRSLSGVSDAVEEERSVRHALEEHARSKLGLELTEVYVERGAAYAEILRRADSLGADYITVGSRGRTGLARVVLGSVAERVVRHAHCSVLIARPQQRSGVVLVATDLSDPSRPAIAAGAAAAKRTGARLVVASALEWGGFTGAPLIGILGSLPALPPVEVQAQVRDALLTSLQQAMASAGAEGEARVLDGTPAHAIVAAAEELGAELVVVGTHGHTGLARLALGSVAESVVASAHCSVLAVRLDART